MKSKGDLNKILVFYVPHPLCVDLKHPQNTLAAEFKFIFFILARLEALISVWIAMLLVRALVE